MMTKEEAYDYFVSQGQTDKAETLRYRPEKTCHFYKMRGLSQLYARIYGSVDGVFVQVQFVLLRRQYDSAVSALRI